MPVTTTTTAEQCTAAPDLLAADAGQRERVVVFLQSIGLIVHVVPAVSDRAFVPGIEVVAGALHVAPAGTVSELLHEAGHLACVPTRYRGGLSGDLGRGLEAMWRDIQGMDLDPDAPLVRAALQCGDAEATAWAWAAGHHLGLPAHVVIADADYSGAGAEIRAMLLANAYCGIHGLMHAGFCRLPRHADGFPRMLKWRQDVDLPNRIRHGRHDVRPAGEPAVETTTC